MSHFTEAMSPAEAVAILAEKRIEISERTLRERARRRISANG